MTRDGDDPVRPFHWDGPLPAPDFVMLPKLVHRQILRHLSGAEFKVFYCLLVKAYEWGNGNAELSLSQLVEIGGVGRASAQRAVATLEERGLIAIHHHRSREHGHEANTYRVLVTDDPRYVDRHPVPKMSIASAQNGQSAAQGEHRSRARSYGGKNLDKEGSITGENKYTRGRYGVCPGCGCRPCGCEGS